MFAVDTALCLATLVCVQRDGETRWQDAWEREAGRKERRPLLQFGKESMLIEREASEAWRRSRRVKLGVTNGSLPFLRPSCAELFGDEVFVGRASLSSWSQSTRFGSEMGHRRVNRVERISLGT